MPGSSSSPGALPWQQEEWLEEATRWIHQALGQLGLAIVGAIEQIHIRPWSTVLRVPTTAGAVFFKATAPMLAHETALTVALARWQPDCLPRLLASEPSRSWMILADGGERLRNAFNSPQDVAHWERILPIYAELQIEMASRQAELLALGILDRRLEKLPEQYALLLADTEILRVGQPEGLTAEEHQRLLDFTPHFAGLCHHLASFGLPETLQHDDFHDGNIFLNNGRYTFFDWGDACVSHPFFSLLVVLRMIAWRFELEPGDPQVHHFRDHYLASWAEYGSPAELLPAFQLAYRLGMVNRALIWGRILAAVELPAREPYADAVAGWLREFLESSPA